jgi:hypothetical protein
MPLSTHSDCGNVGVGVGVGVIVGVCVGVGIRLLFKQLGI